MQQMKMTISIHRSIGRGLDGLLGAALLLACGLCAAMGCDDDGNPPAWKDKGKDAGTSSDAGADAGGTEDVATGGDVGEGPADLLPDGALCQAGEVRCWDELKQATCLPGGVGWLVEPCAGTDVCLEEQGRCVQLACRPGQLRCAPGDEPAVETCAPDGMSWSAPQPCAAEEGCVQGVCLPRFCTPGEQLCGRDRILTCGEDGLSWSAEQCPEGQLCFDGHCQACVRDADCPAGQACSHGECLTLPLAVLTERLPEGMVGEPYAAALEAEGGTPPYAWSLQAGAMPPGLVLDPAGGLAGTPEQAGEQTLRVQVQDAAGDAAVAELVLRIHGSGLAITTDALPAAEEGTEYQAQLEAVGGTPPYAWMLAAGELPAGLSLLAGGVLSGTPGAVGDFPLTFRVFDNTLPPQWAQRDLSLRVTVAPLEILGDQQYDLWLIKLIVLPMITVVEGIPIPYSTQLQARGGVRPYRWSEQPIIDALRPFLPRAGIPEGLTLAEDGTLSGAVTSTEQVISFTIPFTQLTLSGFFFFAQVEDAENPPQVKSAVFLLPTLPIGGAAQ